MTDAKTTSTHANAIVGHVSRRAAAASTAVVLTVTSFALALQPSPADAAFPFLDFTLDSRIDGLNHNVDHVVARVSSDVVWDAIEGHARTATVTTVTTTDNDLERLLTDNDKAAIAELERIGHDAAIRGAGELGEFSSTTTRTTTYTPVDRDVRLGSFADLATRPVPFLDHADVVEGEWVGQDLVAYRVTAGSGNDVLASLEGVLDVAEDAVVHIWQDDAEDMVTFGNGDVRSRAEVGDDRDEDECDHDRGIGNDGRINGRNSGNNADRVDLDACADDEGVGVDADAPGADIGVGIGGDDDDDEVEQDDVEFEEVQEDDVAAPAAGGPSDRMYDQLWGLHNTGQPIRGRAGVAGHDVNWEASRPLSDGTGVVVAVIDSGVELDHADLAGQWFVNPGETCGDGQDNDGNGFVDDCTGWDFVNNDSTVYDQRTRSGATADNGHGTHVSGTIAAIADNRRGVVGVAPGAKILPIKVFENGGSPSSRNAQAIRYAVDMGADVLNLSWGSNPGSPPSAALDEALDYARANDVLVVIAAGNSSSNNDVAPVYPASFGHDNILSIAAHTNTGAIASFSNTGASSVDVSAPGFDILSTVPGGYGYASGTSMAAPHAAGVAALVRSRARGLSAQQAAEAILSTAVAVDGHTGRTATGARVDAAAALGLEADGVYITFSPVGDITEGDALTLRTSIRGVNLPRELNIERRLTLGVYDPAQSQIVGVVDHDIALDDNGNVQATTTDVDALVPVTAYDNTTLHNELESGVETEVTTTLPAGRYVLLVELVDRTNGATIDQGRLLPFEVTALPTPEPSPDPAPQPAPNPNPDPELPDDEDPAPAPDPDPSPDPSDPSDPAPNPDPSTPADPNPLPSDPQPDPTETSDPTPQPTNGGGDQGGGGSDPAPQPTNPAPQPTDNPSDPAPQPTNPNPAPSDPDPSEPSDPAPGPISPSDPSPDPAEPTPNPTAPAPNPTNPAPEPTEPAPEPGDTRRLSPDRGARSGGDLVQVVIDGADGNWRVLFDDTAARNYMVTDSRLYVITPAHAPGVVDVTVRNGAGDVQHVFAGGFTYLDDASDPDPEPDPVDPSDPNEPNPEPTEPTPDPTNPDPNPTDPGDPTDPADPVDPTDPVDPNPEPTERPERWERGTVKEPTQHANGLTVDRFHYDEPLKWESAALWATPSCTIDPCTGAAATLPPGRTPAWEPSS